LSGNYQYTVYSNGSQVDQGSCVVPADEDACNSSYAVTGVESIQVVIDSSNTIPESNEGNNTMTKNCDKFGFTCN
jgi:subtilase family serine protease